MEAVDLSKRGEDIELPSMNPMDGVRLLRHYKRDLDHSAEKAQIMIEATSAFITACVERDRRGYERLDLLKQNDYVKNLVRY